MSENALQQIDSTKAPKEPTGLVGFFSSTSVQEKLTEQLDIVVETERAKEEAKLKILQIQQSANVAREELQHMHEVRMKETKNGHRTEISEQQVRIFLDGEKRVKHIESQNMPDEVKEKLIRAERKKTEELAFSTPNNIKL